ncbi:hypothetical protein E2C01_086859 [Portunus trituberculatus]|uniref:Uncharacterized protein n=1 Tax=Portunus trituberculatus TaxID=210409 RepID=A0A5B7JAF3_PORTR|nr:hypothetical protein [Portunus trituberculatus]
MLGHLDLSERDPEVRVETLRSQVPPSLLTNSIGEEILCST